MTSAPEPGARTAGRHWPGVIMIALLCAAGLLFYRWPYLHGALHSDEASFLLLAELLKSGGLPYRDMWTNHAPGLFFLLAALPEALLRDEALLRLVSVASLALTVLFAGDLLRRAALRWRAIAAGALLFTTLNCLDRYDAMYLETEQVMVLFITLAVWAMLVRRSAAGAWFFWGLALTFKQTAVAFFPLLAVLDLLCLKAPERYSPAALLRRAAAAAGPWLAFLAYFAARQGLPDLLQRVVLDGLHRTAIEKSAKYCRDWFDPQQFAPLATWAAGVGLALLTGWRGLWRSPALRLPLAAGLLWLACGLLYLKIQGCGFAYYAAMLVPAPLLLTAVSLDGAARQWSTAATGIRRLQAAGLLLLLALGALLPGLGLLDNDSAATAAPWRRYCEMVRAASRSLRDGLPDHRLVAVQDQPSWYWYRAQPPPPEVWLPFRLHGDPRRSEQYLGMIRDYGCGRKLLLVYFIPDFQPDYPELARFRGSLNALGARPVDWSTLLPRAQMPPLFSADEWDLTACAHGESGRGGISRGAEP